MLLKENLDDIPPHIQLSPSMKKNAEDNKPFKLNVMS